MIESTFVTAPNTLTVIDMGDSFILSDLAATAVVASPTLNARGMAFRGNNGFAKDKHELEAEIGFVGAQNELQRLTDRHLRNGGKVVRDIKLNASGKRYIERIKLS
ncbi:hypothetical protein GH714_044082 [Hevea brasiliensis]|uniref:DUF7540 domain-containing protein n=1 Tax=Hevea brasiliensis TaxID=3981 RepID=A0A6A6K344_HEVBR|nr:hypothetical protein GH714_044082 [Hevea brasiliensis]